MSDPEPKPRVPTPAYPYCKWHRTYFCPCVKPHLYASGDARIEEWNKQKRPKTYGKEINA